MPRGPKGEWRPADVIKRAVMVVRIATGEIEDEIPPAGSRRGGLKGGKARAKALTPEQRSAAARKAAAKRWKK